MVQLAAALAVLLAATHLDDGSAIKEGETTSDMSLTLETVGCVGCCGLAPVVTENEDVVGDLNPKKVKEIIKMVEGK